jgi:hypothetical protein
VRYQQGAEPNYPLLVLFFDKNGRAFISGDILTFNRLLFRSFSLTADISHNVADRHTTSVHTRVSYTSPFRYSSSTVHSSGYSLALARFIAFSAFIVATS